MINYILVMFALLGSHEMGHEVESDNHNVELHWSLLKWKASFEATEKDGELISAAAFEMQDLMGGALQSPEYHRMSGLHKLQYVYKGTGDIANIGGEYQGFIVISAISDLFGGKFRFAQLNEDTPGLIKMWRF